MDYLKSRRDELKLEDQTSEVPDEVRIFNLLLLEETLTLPRNSIVSSGESGKDASGGVMQNMPKDSNGKKKEFGG